MCNCTPGLISKPNIKIVLAFLLTLKEFSTAQQILKSNISETLPHISKNFYHDDNNKCCDRHPFSYVVVTVFDVRNILCSQN